MATKGVNKVIILGSVGNDPDIRYAPSGACITSISVATSESWKDKLTGQKQERTEWHKIVFFGKLAEIAGEYVKKGSKVYVEGSLKTDKWKDRETGKDRYSTSVQANTLQLLDSATGGAPAQRPAQQPTQHRPQPPAPQHQGGRNETSGPYNDFDNDIPF